ncbi:unnamed protein product [Rotaria sp. Silwood1]|nr:unnamed protein product [Rotaria sp. Silwood1]
MNHINYSQFIWQHYGPLISKNVWYWGKSLIKLNKIKHDLSFLKTCKKEKLIPKFVRFHVTPTHAIYKKAIRQCYQQILTDEIKYKKRQLTKEYHISNNLHNSKKWNVTHNRKLESLRTEYNRTQEDPHISSIDPIKNYSKRKLTTKEHSALVNGLDYVYHNPSFNEKDFISNVETFFVTLLGRCTDKYDWEEKELDENITYNLTPEQLQYAAKLRSISDRFKRNAAKECNLKTKIHKESKLVLRELAQDKSIYITRPDKGKGIVILDHDEYVNKMLEILNDPLTFKTLDHDPTIKKENKLRGTLLKMKKRGFLSEAEYKQAFPVGSHCARIYGLPKIHKSGIPLRPVMSTIGSYNYRLAKLLANKLQPLRKRKTVRQACRRLKEHGAPTNITTIEPSQNLRRSARIAENKKFQIYYGESDTSDYEEVNPEKTITSAIQRHITSTNHKMDWINWSILDRDNHPYRLLVKESLAITENSPSLNRTTRSIPLVVYPEGSTKRTTYNKIVS